MDMIKRPRRLRSGEALRKMVRETRVSPSALIYPAFVVEGEGRREEIPSMPGQYHYSVDKLLYKAEEMLSAGVDKMMLFGVPGHKDAYGSGAWAEDGVVQRAMRALKERFPELYLVGDVCMCEYTSHGHCGILTGSEVDNDKTLDYLCRIALSQVEAGADMVAPSDMMDGRILAIREALDGAGYVNIPIMSYAVKYASAFYGPFRDAADSAPHHGDRKTYQMDPANAVEGLREAAADIDEGADIIMVKPAGPYQDVIRMVADNFDVPVAAYQVSGEYSMIKAAALNGWIDEERIVLESLLGIRRAGAKIIMTYFAEEALKKGWVR